MTKTLGGRKLGVTSAHRRALLRNMAQSLFLHEKIRTTLAKAKELRPFAEKIITDAARGRPHLVRRRIQDKKVFLKLMSVLGPRYQNRAGGYTRILKTESRRGDAAAMGRVELIA